MRHSCTRNALSTGKDGEEGRETVARPAKKAEAIAYAAAMAARREGNKLVEEMKRAMANTPHRFGKLSVEEATTACLNEALMRWVGSTVKQKAGDAGSAYLQGACWLQLTVEDGPCVKIEIC